VASNIYVNPVEFVGLAHQEQDVGKSLNRDGVFGGPEAAFALGEGLAGGPKIGAIHIRPGLV